MQQFREQLVLSIGTKLAVFVYHSQVLSGAGHRQKLRKFIEILETFGGKAMWQRNNGQAEDDLQFRFTAYLVSAVKRLSLIHISALENRFIKVYPELSEKGVGYSIRLSTLQINETKGMNFILKTAMIYGAVVLMVMCLTILSLQQLLDAGKYKYRFGVLRKLGTEESDIKKLMRKQLRVCLLYTS